jgi:hypothetical protein
VPRLVLAAIVAVALWSHLWGVRGDLPWAYASDEGQFAVLAIRMAHEGDPNPRWFGHPGSTFLYPLAALFRVANALDAGVPVGAHDPGLAARVGGDPGRYFSAGRVISALYAVAALPLLFLVGRRAWDEATALVGTWLALLSPITLEHAQMLRTDSAGLFWGLLALWLVLRVLDRPSLGRHVVAGLATGAAIGTRYLLATLVPILVAADLVAAWRVRDDAAAGRALVVASLAGLACVVLGFVLTTPYFLLDFPTVWANLAHEVREEHLGADGLGFAGNLWWYWSTALPRALPAAVLALAALGVALAAWRRNAAALLVVSFAAVFVVAISTATLHWQRWLIQIAPLVALLAASALVAIVRGIARRAGARPAIATALVVLATALVSAEPARAYFRFALAQARPSTKIVAREWMVRNLDPRSTVVADFYTAPLHDTPLRADYHFSLAANGTLEEYVRAGYDYAMVSDAIYTRYRREPRRYAKEVAFYDALFRTGRLVKRFGPADAERGPTISLYALDAVAMTR